MKIAKVGFCLLQIRLKFVFLITAHAIHTSICIGIILVIGGTGLTKQRNDPIYAYFGFSIQRNKQPLIFSSSIRKTMPSASQIPSSEQK